MNHRYPQFISVMSELKKEVKKDPARRVCSECHEIGHSKTSISCPVKKEKNEILKNKIKARILKIDCLLPDKTTEDLLGDIAMDLGITSNQAKTLYLEIPPTDLLDRFVDYSAFIDRLSQDLDLCAECGCTVQEIKANTVRIWKEEPVCDTCWGQHESERKASWDWVKSYKVMKCVICDFLQTKSNERFHFDHLNMFDKLDSICGLISSGASEETLKQEIDKCQILCLRCHHLVTDIESKLGFTRIKQALTRQINTEVITEEEYQTSISSYTTVYEQKMESVYSCLRLALKESQ
jgi:hypothetical protein